MMKLLFESLGAMLAELRDRNVETVRVAGTIHQDAGRHTAGIPRLTSRVIVTAGLDDRMWAEWRFWVGQGLAEIGERGLRVPIALRERGAAALADIRARVVDAGFQVHEGILARDDATLDTFRR